MNNNIQPLGEHVFDHIETIRATTQMNGGLSDWFREYVASDHFAGLPAEEKKQSFDWFSNLNEMLNMAVFIAERDN